MPSKEAHLKQAEYNEKLATFLADKTPYQDWAATMFFYSGLHYVDAVLAESLEHPETHKERTPLVANHAILRRIYREYRNLQVMSENARYNCTEIDSTKLQTIRPQYDALKAYIRGVLKI